MPQAGQEGTSTDKPITKCPKTGLKQVIDACV